jgi:hypothetical protein
MASSTVPLLTICDPPAAASSARPAIPSSHLKQFKFQRRSLNLDWNSILNLNLVRMVNDCNQNSNSIGTIELLHKYVENLTFSDLTDQDIQYFTDANIIQLIRLYQLISEIHLFQHKYFQQAIVAAGSETQQKAQQISEFSNKLHSSEQENILLRRELKSAKKIIKAFERTKELYETERNSQEFRPNLDQQLSAGGSSVNSSLGEIHRCSFCTAQFISGRYLSSHVQRRHPGEPLQATISQQAPAESAIYEQKTKEITGKSAQQPREEKLEAEQQKGAENSLVIERLSTLEKSIQAVLSRELAELRASEQSYKQQVAELLMALQKERETQKEREKNVRMQMQLDFQQQSRRNSVENPSQLQTIPPPREEITAQAAIPPKQPLPIAAPKSAAANQSEALIARPAQTATTSQNPSILAENLTSSRRNSEKAGQSGSNPLQLLSEKGGSSSSQVKLDGAEVLATKEQRREQETAPSAVQQPRSRRPSIDSSLLHAVLSHQRADHIVFPQFDALRSHYALDAGQLNESLSTIEHWLSSGDAQKKAEELEKRIKQENLQNEQRGVQTKLNEVFAAYYSEPEELKQRRIEVNLREKLLQQKFARLQSPEQPQPQESSPMDLLSPGAARNISPGTSDGRPEGHTSAGATIERLEATEIVAQPIILQNIINRPAAHQGSLEATQAKEIERSHEEQNKLINSATSAAVGHSKNSTEASPNTIRNPTQNVAATSNPGIQHIQSPAATWTTSNKSSEAIHSAVTASLPAATSPTGYSNDEFDFDNSPQRQAIATKSNSTGNSNQATNTTDITSTSSLAPNQATSPPLPLAAPVHPNTSNTALSIATTASKKELTLPAAVINRYKKRLEDSIEDEDFSPEPPQQSVSPQGKTNKANSNLNNPAYNARQSAESIAEISITPRSIQTPSDSRAQPVYSLNVAQSLDSNFPSQLISSRGRDREFSDEEDADIIAHTAAAQSSNYSSARQSSNLAQPVGAVLASSSHFANNKLTQSQNNPSFLRSSADFFASSSGLEDEISIDAQDIHEFD